MATAGPSSSLPAGAPRNRKRSTYVWKRTGRCLIPPMKLERSRSGGPSDSILGDALRTSSSNSTCDLHAGQLRAEAEVRTAAAERDVRVRDRG